MSAYEWVEAAMAPNFDVMTEIVGEVDRLFGHMPNSPETRSSIFYFINGKIDSLIASGDFRFNYITPDNQLVQYVETCVETTESNPNGVDIVPVWEYVNEEEE